MSLDTDSMRHAEHELRAMESRNRMPYPPPGQLLGWPGSRPFVTADEIDAAQRRALGARPDPCDACGAPALEPCARYCEANRA